MAREGQPFKGELLIDSHCHVGFNNKIFTPYNDIDSIAANMERIGIDTACVCSYSYGHIGDPFLANDLVADYVNSYPDKFLGYVTLNPNYKECLLDEVLRGAKNGLKLGIKMHTLRQPHNIDDDMFMPVYEYLNEKNAVFLHHWFGETCRLENLLKKFKKITFLTGHFDLEYAGLVKKYENLYINTCAVIGTGRLKNLVDMVGSEKIVYGSDFVALDHTFGYGVVAFAKISDEDKRNILGLNMRRIITSCKH
jgi:predicted TIM-barrel fold metal-dependent hydrolase